MNFRTAIFTAPNQIAQYSVQNSKQWLQASIPLLVFDAYLVKQPFGNLLQLVDYFGLFQFYRVSGVKHLVNASFRSMQYCPAVPRLGRTIVPIMERAP